MGVSPGAGLAESGPFRLVAERLEQLSREGMHRIAAREALFEAACGLVDRTAPHWRGGRGEAFRREFRVHVPAARSVEPAGVNAYRGLAELAGLARELAAAIDEANAHHQSMFSGLLARAVELDERWRIQQRDAVGLLSDADADEARKALDRANAERESYEQTVRALGLRWQQACQGVAAAAAAARDAYAGPAIEPGPAVARHGEASYHAGAVKDDLQRRWLWSTVEPYLRAHREDPAALTAWWGQLSKQERDAVMRQRPDLVVRYLFPHLDRNSKIEFLAINKYATGQRTIEGSFDITVPLKLFLLDVHGEGQVTLRASFNSDGSVDVYTSTVTKGGFEMGLDQAGLFTAGAGTERKIGYTMRFATEDEFWVAHDRLQAALREDAEHPANLGGETRRVLGDVFGANEQGFEVAAGALNMIEGELLQGWAPGRATGTRTNGAYYDGIENEIGVYLVGEVNVRGGPVDHKLELDGRVYRKDGERNYARLTLSGEASASAQLLRIAGFSPIQIEAAGLGDGQKGTASVTVATELTNANRDSVLRLLNTLATGEIEPTNVGALSDGSEVTVAVTTGTAQRTMAAPTNPYLNGEINVSDSSVVHSYRKLPTGELYNQQAQP